MAGVDWWSWQGLAVTEAEREAKAEEVARRALVSEPAGVASYEASGDMMVVAVVDDDGQGATVYDCAIRRRGRVLP